MYEIVTNTNRYTDNLPGFLALIAGCILATALFVFIVNPLHNYIKCRVAVKCSEDGNWDIIEENGLMIIPNKILHWVGIVSALVLHMGFAPSVVYDTNKLKKPGRDSALVALSGIMVYIVCTLPILFVYTFLRYFEFFEVVTVTSPPDGAYWYVYIYHTFYTAVCFLFRICMNSALLNLIPLLPMDMGDVLYVHLNVRWTDVLRNNQILISTCVLVLAFITFGSPDGLIQSISTWVLRVFMEIYTFIIEFFIAAFT